MFNNANTTVLALLISFIFSFAKPYKDEVIVFYKNGYTSHSINGLSIKKLKENMAVLKIPEGKTVKEIIKKLKKDPSVALVIPNYIIKKQAIPNDPYYQDQWYLKKINMENAWDLSTGSNTVYVAVLDTGVDYNHPDLKNNIWLNSGELICKDLNNNGIDDGCENNVDDDGNGYVDDCYGYNAVLNKGSAVDDDGHGTHVAGIIGAIGNNNQGIAGINWNIKIVPCKFLDASGNGDLGDLLECLQYVKTLKNNGLNIVAVNASYGYEGTPSELNIDCSNPSYSNTEKCLMKSINAIFTVAAGNGGFDLIGDDNDKTIFLPCNYSTNLNNVICVGATNSNDEKSSFSNYGANSVDVFAPGGEITSTSNCNKTEEILSTYKNSQYACEVGTSQAAPIIAGTVALLSSYNTSLSLSDIKNRILTTGDNILSLSGYSKTCNRINISNVLFDEKSPKICIDKHLKKHNNEYIYDIGNIDNGGSKTITLKIISSGSAPLSIYQTSLSNSDNFRIVKNTCLGKILNFMETCKLTVSISTCGNNSSILTIKNNSKYPYIYIKLQGNFISTCSNSGKGGCSFSSNTGLNFWWFGVIAFIIFRRKFYK